MPGWNWLQFHHSNLRKVSVFHNYRFTQPTSTDELAHPRTADDNGLRTVCGTRHLNLYLIGDSIYSHLYSFAQFRWTIICAHTAYWIMQNKCINYICPMHTFWPAFFYLRACASCRFHRSFWPWMSWRRKTRPCWRKPPSPLSALRVVLVISIVKLLLHCISNDRVYYL